MPKTTPHPRLRSKTWKTKGGKVCTAYYYDMRGTGQKDIALGTDYTAAVRQWDEIHNRKPREAGTFEEAFKRWEAERLPNYASAETKRDYAKCLRQLRNVFSGGTWADATLPVLKGYLNARSAKTRANREMSLLSIIWNWARLEGLTDLPWPAAGMERAKWKNPEPPREFEVTEALFNAVYAEADQVLRDCMDLASATALRLTDCITVALPSDGMLRHKASKTDKRLTIDVTASPVLLALIERRQTYRASHLLLLSTPTGRQVSLSMLRDRWDTAREAAASRPENAKIADELRAMFLRDMRSRAADLADDLAGASELLQHSSQSLTRKHYRRRAAVLKAVR